MREDLTGLWQAKEGGCEKAREALIHRYGCLVTATRQRAFPQIGHQFGEEMEAEGRLMLVRCVDDFNRSLGVQFPTFAIMRIRGAMRDWLRRDDWLTREDRAKIKRGEQEERELVSFEEWLAEFPNRDLPDPDARVEESALAAVEANLIRTLVGYLPRREREMLVARYWHGLSMTAYGDLVDRGMSRIAQREATALGRLRSWLERTGGIDATAMR